MSKYYLFQDVKKCIGCGTCEIQCKSNKDLPSGPRLCQIIKVGPRMIGDVPRLSSIFMSCFHCENPWCVAACPTGAMQQRSRDGVVFVDSDLCVGCKTCISACPWGAPQWNHNRGKVEKCDYCKDRLDQGLDPACVSTCTAHCLKFGRVEDMTQIRRERHARYIASLENSAF
ncbi:MAG: 4Fe-4S binding protein [Desulfamplus sp.]|nr:4Fe-4S binding protein [Desulfamplus sp.]